EKRVKNLSRIGLTLYQSLLRFHISQDRENAFTVIKYCKDEDLTRAHPKLTSYIDEISKHYHKYEGKAPRIKVAPIDIRTSYDEINVAQTVDYINDKMHKTAVAEEEGEMTRIEAATTYFALLKKMLPVLKSDYKEGNPDQIARDLGNRCLLRCLIESDLELAQEVLNLANIYKIQLHSHFQQKITKIGEITQLFREGRKVVLWLPSEEISDVPLFERILKIMDKGYPLNLEEENVDIEILRLYRLDLLQGLLTVPVEQVFSDTSRLTPIRVVVDLMDFFPSDLIAVKYRAGDLEGLMVVPTGNVDRLQVIHLNNTAVY
ncbi:MAG: hypothetical protein ACTSRU_06635, partial [Candidatus Hodarchaeales archaeon]